MTYSFWGTKRNTSINDIPAMVFSFWFQKTYLDAAYLVNIYD